MVSTGLLGTMLKSKFSPQANKKSSTPKGKNTSNSSYVFSLPPPIPAKLAKKVNEISKYFRKNALSNQKEILCSSISKQL